MQDATEAVSSRTLGAGGVRRAEKTCARKTWSWERRGICYDSCVVSALHTLRFFSEESAVCCEKRRCNLYRLCTDEEKITYFRRLCRALLTQVVSWRALQVRISLRDSLSRQGLSEAKSNLDDGNLRCVKKPFEAIIFPDLKKLQRSRARHARCNKSDVFPYNRPSKSATDRKNPSPQDTEIGNDAEFVTIFEL